MKKKACIFSISLYLLCIFFVSHAQCMMAITDSDGNRITFQKPFARIISLYAAHTENLHELGLNQEIIAVSRSDKLYKDRPRLSFRDDAERFLALHPDLVLIRPMLSRAYPAMVERLRSNGVTVVSLQPTSINGMFRYWKELGRLTGREREAEEMTERFRKEVAEIREMSNRIPASRRKRVYFEAIHSKMKTFAPGSTAIFALETAGGINIASDAKRVRNTNIAFYGKEKLLSKAEEIDVFLSQHGRMNPVTVAEIISTPGFQVIKAVREHKVYLIEEATVSRPVPGLIKGIRKIRDILYGSAR